MAETATQILDTAEELIQANGFHAFSFQDVADRVGIKKASIYYHYPAKAELGRAIVERYRERMRAAMTTLERQEAPDYQAALARYLKPLLALSRNPAHACLCGILSGEYPALPAAMQQQVELFFEEQIAWLAQLLKKGRKAGAFDFEGSPARMAKLCFSAIEGALLIRRVTDDEKQLKQVTDTLRTLLRG